MLFSRNKEDDDDFFPSPSQQSTLASIFGNNGIDGNPSLTYTAPKQPKRQNKPVAGETASTSSSSGTTTTTIIAKAVHAFKLVEKQYQSQGKLGAAVLAGKTPGDGPYQLLMYKSKREHISATLITRDFNFLIQPKNYCTFYDIKNVVWSILFDSVIEMTEFTFQVALARWRAGDLRSAMMVQDLCCPSSEQPKSSGAAVGDSVELSYSLHTLNNTQGLEEVQQVVVKVEGSGWTQGLVGVQPTAKRVIFLQPFMLGDLNPHEIVYDSPVVLKITLLNIVKVQENNPLPTQISLPKVDLRENISKYSQSLAGSGSGEVLVDNNSPKSSPKATKADLISRMARMGQALPFKTPAISDSDETEEERKGERAVPKPRTRTHHSATPPLAPLTAVVAAAAPTLPPPVAMTQHPAPVHWVSSYMGSNVYPVPQLQSPAESQTQAQLNMFFSEVRTTNSELRMGITRLTDKVEALQDKITNTFEKNVDTKPAQEGVASVLERLLENDQQLKERLHSMMTALTSSQQSASQSGLNGEVAAVGNCQLCTDKDADGFNSGKLEKLQEENEFLSATVCAQKDALQNAKIADRDQLAQIEDLQKQLSEERGRISSVLEDLSNVSKEKENSVQELEKANSLMKELQETIQEKQVCIDKLEQRLIDNESVNVEEMKRNLQEVFNPKPVVAEHIKRILNAVYRLVKLQFEPDYQYDSVFIHSVLAETIKAVTLEYLENGDLSSGEKQQPLPDSMTVGQTQSAPVFMSGRKSDDVNAKQYMKKDQRSEPELCPKFPTSALADEPSVPTLAVLQETSASSVTSDSTSSHNGKGDNHEVNGVATKQNPHNFEAESVKPSAEMNSSALTSADESSEDVLRKPPTPPLFNEEENEDDWLNSS